MSEKTYRAAVIGLGRMGSTFDDEIKQGGQFFYALLSCTNLCGLPPYRTGRRRRPARRTRRDLRRTLGPE